MNATQTIRKIRQRIFDYYDTTQAKATRIIQKLKARIKNDSTLVSPWERIYLMD